MKIEIIVTLVGLTVAGLAAVLGIWMERDKQKPPRFAYGLSLLILMATAVGMFQSYLDAKQGDKMEAEMARMLQMLDKIASSSDVEIPELSDFVKGEIAAQSRANPKVVEKMAQRMADEGEDPAEVLGSYLPAADVEKMQRKGELKIRPPSTKLAATAEPVPAASGDAVAGEGAPMDKKARRKLRMSGVRVGAAAAAKAEGVKEEKKAADKEAAEQEGKESPAASASASASAAASAAPSAEASGKPRVALGGRKPEEKAKPAETGKPVAAPKLTPPAKNP